MKKRKIPGILAAALLVCLCLLAGCGKEEESLNLTLRGDVSARIDLSEASGTFLELPTLFEEAAEGVRYEAGTDTEHLKLSLDAGKGTLNITSDGTTGEYTVHVTASKEGKKLLTFDIAVNVVDLVPDPAVTKEIPALSASLPTSGPDDAATYECALDLSEYFSNIEGAAFEMESTDKSAKMECDPAKPWLVRLSFQGAGERAVTIYAVRDGTRRAESSFRVTLSRESPASQTKEIPDLSGSIPIFLDQRGAAVCEHTLDLSEYFPNVEGAAFEMECADKSAKMESDPVEPWRVKLSFREPGERIVTIRVTRGGERVAEASFRVTLTAETPRQLFNGDFESGLAGWDLDADGLAAYAVIDDPVDIWNNNIFAEGAYLYGYHDENGTCEFTSSLFELDGTGYITWKMAGNCTENLQFILMQYNDDGEDVEIAKFNNWYYGEHGLSGFIFRDYYYQVDMDSYGGSKCYFIVRDNATRTEPGGFAFVNLDSIVTYHEQAPDLSGMYPAGYRNAPEGQRPETVVQKEIQALSAGVPLFPGKEGLTAYEYALDLSAYFSNVEAATFEMECTEESAKMECDPDKPWLVRLSFQETGEKIVTIYAVKDGMRRAETSFQVTLTGEVPKQLLNGDFENGLTGWDLDDKSLAAYTVFDSPVDIWDNDIGAEGAYLYGYYNEDGTCEFTSSLFEMDGTGYITWKMAGNCTENLQFILMQYNEDGEDVEIARFNNWYYGAHGQSGFIFRDYYYQVDMDSYGGDKCYFIVRDNATKSEPKGFGFLNLDSIVTYYPQKPNLPDLYCAGYIHVPEGQTKEIPDLSGSIPIFPDQRGAAVCEHTLDLSEYFPNVEGVAFEMECADKSAKMESDPVEPWRVKLSFREPGERIVTIRATRGGERVAEASFRVTLTAETPRQLFNGDFESGLAGWDLDADGLAAYAVIDSPVDIWGNGIDAEGSYLYGYHNESGTCEFTSSLFELDGTGYITWKMAGNCTENLQFILMQYNEDGEDTEIAKFNNWYFGVYGLSGFIFRDYYYQVDMDNYGGSKCYFIVRDNATDGGFAFMNLDSIITYHEQAPDLSDMYPAGYLTDPR